MKQELIDLLLKRYKQFEFASNQCLGKLIKWESFEGYCFKVILKDIYGDVVAVSTKEDGIKKIESLENAGVPKIYICFKCSDGFVMEANYNDVRVIPNFLNVVSFS